MSYSNPSAGSFLTRAGNYNVAKQILDEVITLSRYIDTAVDNLTSGAFYKIFQVPDNFFVSDAFVICGTVEGAVETLDIVDDDSATTTFVSNADLSTAEGTVTATNARKMYSAAGFICVRPDAALTACSFYVVIRGVVLSTSL